jgi:uncharacterized protein DUF5060/uncharacterized protein DUF4038
VQVDGFYDGDGAYKVRFSPDNEGEWTYGTRSNRRELDGQTGAFLCVAPSAKNHGPVSVRNTYDFGYADGTPYFPFGTTCYAWTHQPVELQQQTLETLRQAPFNKMRMCVFPKWYTYNQDEPPVYPFPRAQGQHDYTRFVPEFFRNLERRISQLQALGIEADLILFHPYDHWGYALMPPEVDDRYLRYVVARLAAFRNVWWSSERMGFREGQDDGRLGPLFPHPAGERSLRPAALHSSQRSDVRPHQSMGHARQHSGRRFQQDL